MIYFVAGLKTHAKIAADRLRIHPTGWKYLTDAMHLHGVDRAVIIYLTDTLDHPMPALERDRRAELTRMIDRRRVSDGGIQVAYLELDHIP